MITYTIGGGCFWCLDAVFRHIKGVVAVESGYAGGSTPTTNYEQVSTGTTGHAEVVRVSFDETVITSDVILDIYFLIHNPTTLNRQGADTGTQYRSIMLYENSAEHDAFTAAVHRAQQFWDDPIVTEITPLYNYSKAENEHQDYFANNPSNGYCSIVIEPKITKARMEYKTWFQEAAL
jgi:peptide-methionine (S)-S-oxide reductase